MFLDANDNFILHHDNIHKQKLQNLLKISSNNTFSDSHNPDRVILNFSSCKLTDDKKNVLCKGLNFSVKLGLIEYSEFLLHFALLFYLKKREDLCNKDMSLIKTRLIETALTSYQNFSSDRDYIDDIFVMFSSPVYADKFREYLSSKHSNIKLSLQKEQDGCLRFLDIKIFRKNDKFATNVYRKKTFSGVYTNLRSFIPETFKTGLIKSLFRFFSLWSDFIKFHHEIDKSKSILCKNSYPSHLVDKRIKEFLDKILAPKPVVSTVAKKNLVIALPYLGKLSLQIHTRISRIMKNKLPYCNIRIVFQCKCKISNFFTFKD